MRALIVDDEARVRKAVRLLVDWERHGIDVIEEAESGTQAIECIRTLKPAIVIMDMMMEKGNGVELMTWVSEFAASVKFIVVSGHDDFDFVRHTVRHGGIDYILKPIDPEAINTAVSKAVTAWNHEEQERHTQQKQNIQLNEFKPIYGERLLSSLIDEPMTAEASLRRLRLEGVIPDRAVSARLLLLQMDVGDSPLLQRFGNDNDLLYYAIMNICNEFLLIRKRGVAFRYWGAPTEIAIILWDQPEAAKELISDINQGLFHTLQRRIHLGMGSTGALPQSLPAQYAEAATALRRRNLLNPEEYVHSSTDDNTSVKGLFANMSDDWRTSVMSGQPALLEGTSKRWIDELTRCGVVTPEILSSWRADAILFRSQLLREHIGDDAESAIATLESSDLLYPAPFTNGYSFSLFSWRDWSYSFMQRLSQELLSRQGSEYKTMNQIVKYIEHHYQSELSLQEVAQHFSVSREYISRKFKQELGINFSDYIAKYRIDKAKLLLQNPHFKISQISEMVGFRDVKYFSKVFKKQEGVTPQGYRRLLLIYKL
ncbi:two-component system response regulator YesN [Paenibacillus sp. DS2015]|uniref:response regulator transcription factor n=1 Tax=Paenibacillus sp. DS2015 TaxID=3373917 RepID=UPI003D229625